MESPSQTKSSYHFPFSTRETDRESGKDSDIAQRLRLLSKRKKGYSRAKGKPMCIFEEGTGGIPVVQATSWHIEQYLEQPSCERHLPTTSLRFKEAILGLRTFPILGI